MQALTKERHISHPVDSDDDNGPPLTLEEFFGEMENIVGDLVAGYRYKNKMTQKQLAARLGVSVRRIYEWENGKRFISDNDADRLSDVLAMPKESFSWRKKGTAV